MKNLGEALEGLLAHHLAAANRQQISATVQEQAPIGQPKRAARTSPKVERLQQNRREERLAAYSQVMALQKLGMSQQAIASQVGISDSTVQRWLAAGTFPERKPADAGQPT